MTCIERCHSARKGAFRSPLQAIALSRRAISYRALTDEVGRAIALAFSLEVPKYVSVFFNNPDISNTHIQLRSLYNF